ncbi:MAG: hypothetical protein ACREJU_08240 [Nitrospiraceae bacterium]
MLPGLPACIGRFHDRLVYDQRGVQIGIQPDPTIDVSLPGGINSHPVRQTADEIRKLISSIHVSGYSGTIAGLFATPQPIPLLTDEEAQLVSQPIAVALSQAGPRERVFFSIPNLDKPYHRERTEGALFVRGPLFYLTLSDHSVFIRTDTGGGDDQRDPRDTKGMKLWAAGPTKAATPPPKLAPQWGPYEKVHIALLITDVLAPPQASSSPPRRPDRARGPSPASTLNGPQAASQTMGFTASETEADLRLQIRELTSSNLELRARLEEQTKDVQTLKEELSKVQRELEKAASKLQPRRKAPAINPP